MWAARRCIGIRGTGENSSRQRDEIGPGLAAAVGLDVVVGFADAVVGLAGAPLRSSATLTSAYCRARVGSIRPQPTLSSRPWVPRFLALSVRISCTAAGSSDGLRSGR